MGPLKRSRSQHANQLTSQSWFSYHNVDWLYGQPGVDSGQGFTKAQGESPFTQSGIVADLVALLNVIEVILNIEYLYLRHTSPRSQRKGSSSNVVRYHGHAPLVGFASALMTLSKTALYWLQGRLPPHKRWYHADHQNGTVDGAWSGIMILLPFGVYGHQPTGTSSCVMGINSVLYG